MHVSPFCEDAGQIGLGPPVLENDLILTTGICGGPIAEATSWGPEG